MYELSAKNDRLNSHTVMNVRTFHNLCFQPLNVIYFHPEIGSHSFGAFNSSCISKQKRIFSVISVKPGQGNFPVFCLSRNASRMIKCQRICKLCLFSGNGNRPGSAVLQKLSVGNVRMADGPVRKKASCLIHAGCLYHQRGDGSVNICLTYHRNSFIIQQRICSAGHNSQLTLELIPALDSHSFASVLFNQIFHGHF